MGKKKRNKRKRKKKKKTGSRKREVIVVKKARQYRARPEDIARIAKEFFPQGYYCVGQDKHHEGDTDQVLVKGL